MYYARFVSKFTFQKPRNKDKITSFIHTASDKIFGHWKVNRSALDGLNSNGFYIYYVSSLSLIVIFY